MHITLKQRYTICTLKKEGYTQSKIAQAIGKSKSVISRELQRNCTNTGDYEANIAQKKYEHRKAAIPKKKRFTEAIKALIEEKLSLDYSPEQIVGRAKLEGLSCVSTERIYQHIWEDKKKKGLLYQKLRRKGRKYRKRGALKDARGLIKNRVDIDERPKIVDDKSRFGDLEIDTVIGKNHKGAILSINDRATSFVWLGKLEVKEAKATADKTIELLLPIKELIHTITSDNGKEFAHHQHISQKLAIDLYFAKPYHSWERGANENMNGLIRQYFPKGTSFESVSEIDLQRVQNILNNRPRKKLGFLTPNEFILTKFDIKNINQKVAFVT